MSGEPAPRVLQLAKHFPPDRGGIETVTKKISDLFAVRGVTADVLCFAVPGETYADDRIAYKLFRAKPSVQIGNKIFSFDYFRQLRSLSQQYDIGILHMPNPVAALAALLFWHKPLALIWHADSPPQVQPLIAPLDRAIARRADVVIAPTPAHIEGSPSVAELRGKSAIVRFPFDESAQAAPARDGPGYRSIRAFVGDRQFILAVGRLVPYKGIDVLVEAAERMTSDAAIVIVGVGGLKQDLARQIAAGDVADRVMLAGGLGDGELNACYADAAVLCMPSRTRAEMYGLVQVEAMSFGTPVVSTRIANSGVSWVNRDGQSGLTVPVEDPTALAVALDAIITDPALAARLGKGARMLFEAEHRDSVVVAQYIDIIRRAAGWTGPEEGKK